MAIKRKNSLQINRVIIEEFSKLAGLNELEVKIMEGRMLNVTRTAMSMEYGISLATLDRTLSKLKDKYDAVQPYSDKLPKRRDSDEEEYMDNN